MRAPFVMKQIMYAYDYATRSTIRLRGGHYLKKVMRDGLLKEKNVTLFERVMITNLLTEEGKQNSRIVGATGINEETGEFYVFSAKSVIIATAGVSAQGTSTWTCNFEMFGNGYRAEPRNTGDGVQAEGRQSSMVKRIWPDKYVSPFGWLCTAWQPGNTWHACPPWTTTRDPRGFYGNPISQWRSVSILHQPALHGNSPSQPLH